MPVTILEAQQQLEAQWAIFHNHKPIFSQPRNGPWCDWCTQVWPCPSWFHAARNSFINNDNNDAARAPSEQEIQTAIESIRKAP